MSNTIDFFFSKKKTPSLPPNCANFLKEELEDSAKKSILEKENSKLVGEELSSKELSETKKELIEVKKELFEAKEKLKQSNEIIFKQNSDIKLLKHSLNSSSRLCVQKDLQIERLLKGKKDSQIQKPAASVLFDKFENSLDSVALKDLKSVPNNQTNDSTFVLKLMRYLYADNLSVLLTKSVSGKSKTAISPVKKNLIENILKERIIAGEHNENQIALRASRAALLINDAIKNIVRPLKKQGENKVSSTTTINTNTNTYSSVPHPSVPHASGVSVITEPPPLAPIAKKRKL